MICEVSMFGSHIVRLGANAFMIVCPRSGILLFSLVLLDSFRKRDQASEI